MLLASSNYNSDKLFGKLITTVIKTSGTNLQLIYKTMKHVLYDHKSVWKSQAQKYLNNYENCKLSESILY